MKNLFLLPALIAGFGFTPAGPATAQTFTTLHSFTGTTSAFLGISDGANPEAGLILSGSTLYGTASKGGSSSNGTVFKVNTDGAGFTNLHSFTGGDGDEPSSGLLLLGTTLYGTANAGGSSRAGTVFAVNTNGSDFTNLHSFTALNNSTNSDGAGPRAVLILSHNTLYGTAYYGGSLGAGTVFAVNTNGTGFTNLHTFATPPDDNPINNDGAYLSASLILSENTLYGVAEYGGSLGNGTVFKVNTNGTGFTILHIFTTVFSSALTNSDGAHPLAGLILSGNTLYGTAKDGGSSGFGTVFKLNTNGTGFTTLYAFTQPFGNSATNSDGANPRSGLILSGNTLYGTAYQGGSSGYGTVFSLSLPQPALTIIPSGGDAILTWPTNAFEYNLQSATNLLPSAVWSAVSPGPVVIGGQNVVINPISGAQKFYRLIQ